MFLRALEFHPMFTLKVKNWLTLINLIKHAIEREIITKTQLLHNKILPIRTKKIDIIISKKDGSKISSPIKVSSFNIIFLYNFC